jgi:hypothetical protein
VAGRGEFLSRRANVCASFVRSSTDSRVEELRKDVAS